MCERTWANMIALEYLDANGVLVVLSSNHINMPLLFCHPYLIDLNQEQSPVLINMICKTKKEKKKKKKRTTSTPSTGSHRSTLCLSYWLRFFVGML